MYFRVSPCCVDVRATEITLLSCSIHSGWRTGVLPSQAASDSRLRQQNAKWLHTKNRLLRQRPDGARQSADLEVWKQGVHVSCARDNSNRSESSIRSHLPACAFARDKYSYLLLRVAQEHEQPSDLHGEGAGNVYGPDTCEYRGLYIQFHQEGNTVREPVERTERRCHR